MATHRERGASLIELLIGVSVLILVFTAVGTFVVQNSQANTAEHMTIALQADARNSLALIENVLRTAGWDPKNIGFAAVTLDSSPSGPDNFIQVFADLNADDDTLDPDENITIRHSNNAIEWRRTYDTTAPFEVVADDITNDEDGDGVIEPMFTPDSTTNPTRITVKITARSPRPDPRSGQHIRCTLTSDVTLRGSL